MYACVTIRGSRLSGVQNPSIDDNKLNDGKSCYLKTSPYLIGRVLECWECEVPGSMEFREVDSELRVKRISANIHNTATTTSHNAIRLNEIKFLIQTSIAPQERIEEN
jgi:hypothetical protein